MCGRSTGEHGIFILDKKCSHGFNVNIYVSLQRIGMVQRMYLVMYLYIVPILSVLLIYPEFTECGPRNMVSV